MNRIMVHLTKKKLITLLSVIIHLLPLPASGDTEHTLKSNCRLNTTATAREEGECPACRQERIEKYQAKLAEDKRIDAEQKATNDARKMANQEQAAKDKATQDASKPGEVSFVMPNANTDPQATSEFKPEAGMKQVSVWAVLETHTQGFAFGSPIDPQANKDESPVVYHFYTPVYLVDTHPRPGHGGSSQDYEKYNSNRLISSELRRITINAAREIIAKESLVNVKIHDYPEPRCFVYHETSDLKDKWIFAEKVGTRDEFIKKQKEDTASKENRLKTYVLDGLEFKYAKKEQPLSQPKSESVQGQ